MNRRRIRCGQLLRCLLALTLTGCAPLHPNNTPLEDVGEVALRVVAFPLTLGFSELLIADARQRDAARQAAQAHYARWFQSLSPAEQARELERAHERNLAAIAALGWMMMGTGGPFAVQPALRPTPNPLPGPARPNTPVSCFSSMTAWNAWTTCY